MELLIVAILSVPVVLFTLDLFRQSQGATTAMFTDRDFALEYFRRTGKLRDCDKAKSQGATMSDVKPTDAQIIAQLLSACKIALQYLEPACISSQAVPNLLRAAIAKAEANVR